MTPSRSATINGHLVQEYYWAGEYVVYVDRRAAELPFEDAIAKAAGAQS